MEHPSQNLKRALTETDVAGTNSLPKRPRSPEGHRSIRNQHDDLAHVRSTGDQQSMGDSKAGRHDSSSHLHHEQYVSEHRGSAIHHREANHFHVSDHHHHGHTRHAHHRHHHHRHHNRAHQHGHRHLSKSNHRQRCPTPPPSPMVPETTSIGLDPLSGQPRSFTSKCKTAYKDLTQVPAACIDIVAHAPAACIELVTNSPVTPLTPLKPLKPLGRKIKKGAYHVTRFGTIYTARPPLRPEHADGRVQDELPVESTTNLTTGSSTRLRVSGIVEIVVAQGKTVLSPILRLGSGKSDAKLPLADPETQCATASKPLRVSPNTIVTVEVSHKDASDSLADTLDADDSQVTDRPKIRDGTKSHKRLRAFLLN